MHRGLEMLEMPIDQQTSCALLSVKKVRQLVRNITDESFRAGVRLSRAIACQSGIERRP
jgi:hypothetical protein